MNKNNIFDKIKNKDESTKVLLLDFAIHSDDEFLQLIEVLPESIVQTLDLSQNNFTVELFDLFLNILPQTNISKLILFKIKIGAELDLINSFYQLATIIPETKIRSLLFDKFYYIGYERIVLPIDLLHKISINLYNNTINSTKLRDILQNYYVQERNPDCLYDGKGEYLVFDKDYKKLAPKLYVEAYNIINLNCRTNNKYDIILKSIQKLDSNLRIAFIPTTLYELIFIRKCITEDMRSETLCKYNDIFLHEHGFNNIENIEYRQKRKCWHVAYFDFKVDQSDEQQAGILESAYRLNKSIIKLLKPTSSGFNLDQILNFTENEIIFLANHYGSDIPPKEKNAICPGLTSFFSSKDYNGGCVRPMGIRDNKDVEILLKAIKLECKVKNSTIIYRGTNSIQETSPFYEDKLNSLSYGGSLFAGCLYDSGATTWQFSRNFNYAYALIIPYDEIDNSVFYIPLENTLVQLYSQGEFFHARSTFWKDYQGDIAGIAYIFDYREIPRHLLSNLSQDDFLKNYKYYYDRAVYLKK